MNKSYRRRPNFQPDEKPILDNEVERRRKRMTDKIADAIQYILLAVVVSSAAMLMGVKSEQDKMGVTVSNLGALIASMQQKLEIMADTKVNKSDFALDKAGIYERLRAVESDQKIMADSLRKSHDQSLEIAKQLSEVKRR